MILLSYIPSITKYTPVLFVWQLFTCWILRSLPSNFKCTVELSIMTHLKRGPLCIYTTSVAVFVCCVSRTVFSVLSAVLGPSHDKQVAMKSKMAELQVNCQLLFSQVSNMKTAASSSSPDTEVSHTCFYSAVYDT